MGGFSVTRRRIAGRLQQLTDAIARLLHNEQVQAYRFEGKRCDCGSKPGYLQATVVYALQHPDLLEPFLVYLESEFSSTANIPGAS